MSHIGSYWGVKDITYKIAQYTAEMARADVDKVITNAFNVWEKYSPLRFVKVDGSSTTDVNIEVKFAKGDHGDGEPFDGRGQILAHAFFPRYGGDVHFDDDEPWRALQGKGGVCDVWCGHFSACKGNGAISFQSALNPAITKIN
jgi:matrix metalloproteinase-14 (membrane-inserted)